MTIVRIELRQYREGRVDFNRVFSVQELLTRQQDQLAIAQGAVDQNLIQLYRSLGGGWQIRLYTEPFTEPLQPAEAVRPQEAGAPRLPPLPPPVRQP